MEHEIALFQYENKNIEVKIDSKHDTVWLNRAQLASLFDRDIKTIGKHINNALKEELDNATVAKFATVQNEGNRTVTRNLEYYNLDMIISIGYRVKSKRGVAFRRWANNVLKDYILKGYAVNNTRMAQLGKIIQLMKRTQNSLDAKQVLSVIEQYNIALNLLDDYDHQTVKKPDGNKTIYTLNYEECRSIINKMKISSNSTLFGTEKDESFKSSIGNIFQTFSGKDIYLSLEEKAANLLYFITKNHSFLDGNKRIAATIFLYFLDKNNALFINGEKRIADYTLVALTIMIAESCSKEKEMMINIIMNCIV